MLADRPIWFIALVATVLMAAAVEFGYQNGRRGGGVDSCVAAVKASVLALVGLLLAFSYSMAVGHYDQRIQSVLREAKALKTCWLRADLAAEPARTRARELLASIVDSRSAMFHVAPASEIAQQAMQDIAEYQRELWALSAEQIRESKEPEKHSLLVQSVNDVIATSGERTAAFENRVPGPVMYLLIAAAMVAGFLIGFSSGQDRRRVPVLWCLVLGLMVFVLTMIFDLDTPGRGFIADRVKPLEDVKAAMSMSMPNQSAEP